MRLHLKQTKQFSETPMQNSTSLIDPIEIDVARLPAKGRRLKVDISKRERLAIAESFSLLEVAVFNAELHITRWRRDGVKIEGLFKAEIEQPCVLTLEPVSQIINEEFSQLLVPEGSPFAKPELDANGEMLLDPEGADLPDTFDGTIIDLSLVLLEVFALAIDPHPRAKNVALEDIYQNEADEEEEAPSPFAVLAQLKNGKTK